MLIFPRTILPSRSMSISLYPHQRQALDKLGSGSILCGGVGSGKSRTAIAYYFCHVCNGSMDDDGNMYNMKSPVDLYIITTARKRDTLDWEDELAPFLLSPNREVCYWPVNVHIDSWNNIKKYADVTNAFFIFDEQRVVGYGTWVKTFLKIAKANRWILLSATPGDTWSDYIPVFIANGFYKNKTDFTRQHCVYARFAKYPKIERYVGTKKLERCRDRILVTMEFEKHTVRHFHDIFTPYDERTYLKIQKDRWNLFTDEPIKDASEACLALRRVVNTDPSKVLEILKLFLDYHKIVIFYNFDYELEILRKMCKDNRISYGEWNGHNHQVIPNTDGWLYLVQYTAGAEGWNCVETNCVIFYSLNYSYKIMEQAAGRIDRLNTPFKDLHYYRLRTHSSIDEAIFSCFARKRRFNENVFAGKLGVARKSCAIIEREGIRPS